jgi:hypothetical protein
MRNIAFAFFLAVLILLLESCPNPGGTDTTPPGSIGGSLTIVLSSEMKPLNTRDPTIAMSYNVLGSGPGSASFQRTGIEKTIVTIDSLEPGDWGVTVNGNNFMNEQIGSASIHATVAAGETTTVAVTATQVGGSGTLELSLNWTENPALSSAVVSLTPLGGVPYTLTLPAIATADGISSINASVAVPTGFYTLSRVYKNNDKSAVAWGAADALQITFAHTTRLVLLDGQVTIKPDISKNITIDFDNSKTNFGKGEIVTIAAKPTPQPSMKVSSYAYQWYLNGEPIDSVPAEDTSSSSTTIDMHTLAQGIYRLDVVVSANETLSSKGFTFTIAGG